jgi:hypothetical protein
MGCIMKEMYMLMLLSKYFGHDCKLVLLMLMLTINLSSTDYKLQLDRLKTKFAFAYGLHNDLVHEVDRL